MTKERTVLRHKIASLIDPLTGLSNRRAFLSDAEALIATRLSRSEPLAVLLPTSIFQEGQRSFWPRDRRSGVEGLRDDRGP